MIGEIIVAAVIATPLLLGLFFRTSTTYIFFSLMTGELLGRYFGEDLDHLVEQLTKSTKYEGYGEIMLIVIPMVLTAYILRGSIAKGKWIMHILPLAVTGIIFSAFVLSVTPENIQELVRESSAGDLVMHLNKSIIGVLLVVQLLSLWIINHIKHSRRRKHSKD